MNTEDLEIDVDGVFSVSQEQDLADVYQVNLENVDLEEIEDNMGVTIRWMPGISLKLFMIIVSEVDTLDLVNGLEEFPEMREEFMEKASRISEKYEVENHHTSDKEESEDNGK